MGTSSIIDIPVSNTTGRDIVLPKRLELDRLQLLRSVTPLEVKLSDEGTEYKGPVVQKPINANLGLNFLNLGLIARLSNNPRLKQGLNLTLLARWVNLLIGRLTRIQNGRRRSEKRKHVKFLVKQTVYKDFMEENQPQKGNSKSINTIKILICPV
jgi:hypothetical protein